MAITFPALSKLYQHVHVLKSTAILSNDRNKTFYFIKKKTTMKFARRIKYDYLPNTKRKPAPEILWQGLEDEILKVNLK